jgi:hypothetical protein
MSDISLSKDKTIAQELGADPQAAREAPLVPIDLAAVGEWIEDTTRAHPRLMLGIAFVAGAVLAGRRRR